jgi:hypothetical protein
LDNKTFTQNCGYKDQSGSYTIFTPGLSLDDVFVTEQGTQTLSNKTISYSANTLTGVQSTITVEYAESEALSTTTATTYQQKLRLTTSALPAGTYYLSWYAEICNTNNDKEMSARVEQDDTIELALCRNSSKIVSNDPFHTFSGIKQVSLNGVHTFDIDYLADSETAQIQRARLKISSV